MANAPVVVIGIGNPLRGDDEAGLAVVRRLHPRPGVRVIEQDGEAGALADALRSASAALIIDAAAGAEPGTVRRLDAAAQPLPHGLGACSTHGFGVAEGIELARALGVLPTTCVVYALEGCRFETGAAMSAAVVEALDEARSRIETELDGIARCVNV